MFTSDDLLADLRAMGVKEGDSLLVHSSFRSMGCVQGGPAAVIEALQRAVGPDGLLTLPTFTFGASKRFSLVDSPSRTGAITEVFRLMPDVYRSAHPTHATALWGRAAAEVAAAHDETAGLDIGSPFDLAALRPGARILLVGVTSQSNSYIHVCEAIVGLPYVEETHWDGKVHEYDVVYPDGRTRHMRNLRTPGCSKGFEVVDRWLEKKGILGWERLGGAMCRAMKPGDVLDAARALTAVHSDALLCLDPACGFCPRARKALKG